MPRILPLFITLLMLLLLMGAGCNETITPPPEWRYWNQSNGLGGNTVNRIWVDNATLTWFATNGGLSRLAGEDMTNYTSADGLPSDEVWSVCRSEVTDDLWVGTPDGAGCLPNEGPWITYDTSDGLLSNHIRAVFPDNEGGVWLATDGGLSHFLSGTITNYTTAQGMPCNQFWDVYVAQNGDVWAGSEAGAVKLPGGSGSPVVYNTSSGLADDIVYCVYVVNGDVWFGTANGATLMRGTNMMTLRTYQGLSSNLIYDITEDREGGIWFATGGGGVSRYYLGEFQNYSSADGLTGDYVLAVAVNELDSKWFGLLGAGVNRLVTYY
jgi:ligand-binding sensor domain-containing protein